ncbi:MAG: hypothetical protein GPJ54_09405 [Candidatus Heimdallarchaeota archaeon]|nr:hypothetical protein [Candidatus Heimdallarchaeota archaeon]
MKLTLTSLELKLLIAIGETVRYSLGGHYSKQEILKRFDRDTLHNPKKMRKIDKAFKKLRSKQLIQIHPTGETTFELSRAGLNYLRDILGI